MKQYRYQITDKEGKVLPAVTLNADVRKLTDAEADLLEAIIEFATDAKKIEVCVVGEYNLQTEMELNGQ